MSDTNDHIKGPPEWVYSRVLSAFYRDQPRMAGDVVEELRNKLGADAVKLAIRSLVDRGDLSAGLDWRLSLSAPPPPSTAESGKDGAK